MYFSPSNRSAFVNNLFIQYGCDRETRELLEKLNNDELKILVKYPDLLERVKTIAKMSDFCLDHLIRTNYGFRIDSWAAGDYLLSVSELGQRAPDWCQSEHVGWTFHTGDVPQFCKWARDFLMQEVRINVWMRYIEYKKAALKSNTLEIDPADILAAAAGFGHFGSYL